MRISHKFRFVFISKPRCGSTSIRRMLDPFSDIFGTPFFRYHYHTTAYELKLHFKKMGWNWDEYFIFTTIRNPWDMMVSYYTFFKPDVNFIYNYEKERSGIKYQENNLSSFENWVLHGMLKHHLLIENGKYYKKKKKKGFRRISLKETAFDISNKMIVKKVLKIENINQTLPSIFKMLGINSNFRLLKINSSKHENYRKYYSSETKKRVEKDFEVDIEVGKYLF